MEERSLYQNANDFPPELWEVYSVGQVSYYQLKGQPNDDYHKKIKKAFRLPSSRIERAIHGAFGMTPAQVALEIAGYYHPGVSERRVVLMNRGQQTEGEIRNWYIQTYSSQEWQVKINLVNITVPKENPIGDPKLHCRYSNMVDGVVTYQHKLTGQVVSGGILEFKTVDQVYPELLAHQAAMARGEKFPPFYHTHLKAEHYAQCQSGLSIRGASWCDYVVYGVQDLQVYTERLYFNESYWRETRAAADQFITQLLDPVIERGPSALAIDVEKTSERNEDQ